MKLVLTDNTQIEIDSMSTGDNGKLGSEDELYVNIFFKLEEDEDPIEKRNKIKELLTPINVAGAFVLLDNNKKINLHCKELTNIILRISDMEYALSGSFTRK